MHVLLQLPVHIDQRQMWVSWQSSREKEATLVTFSALLSLALLSCQDVALHGPVSMRVAP